jgi:hypothetical protein
MATSIVSHRRRLLRRQLLSLHCCDRLEKHLANPVKRLTIAVERLTNVVKRPANVVECFVNHGGRVVYRLLPDTHDSRLVTVGVGEGRARTAVVLVAQACEVSRPVFKTVMHGLDFGHGGINASKKLPRDILVLVLGKRFCCRSRSAFGQLVAMLLVSLIGQRVFPYGRLTSLMGLVGQRGFPRGRFVATAPVEIGGIKLGYLCGGEWRGKMSRR